MAERVTAGGAEGAVLKGGMGDVDAGVEDADLDAGAGIAWAAHGAPGVGYSDQAEGEVQSAMNGMHTNDALDAGKGQQRGGIDAGGGDVNGVEDHVRRAESANVAARQLRLEGLLFGDDRAPGLDGGGRLELAAIANGFGDGLVGEDESEAVQPAGGGTRGGPARGGRLSWFPAAAAGCGRGLPG